MRSLQTIQVGIGAMEVAETNHSFQIVGPWIKTNIAQLDFGSLTNSRFAFFSRDYNPLSALRKVMTVKTEQNMVMTAIALRRYELQYETLPITLDQLVPAFLKVVPLDYMDGQPLRYQKKSNEAFLLYSVGLNGKDDGGNPSQPALPKYLKFPNYRWDDNQALGWVWPQPATSTRPAKQSKL